MIFTYHEATYGMEGMWDSATEIGGMNFMYQEIDKWEELVAERRKAKISHTLPGVAVDFINLEQDLTDDPDELLIPHTKLCVVSWHHEIPFIPEEFNRALFAFGYARTGPYPTEEEYYKAKVDGHLRMAAGVIRNVYLTAMVRQDAQSATPKQ